MSKKPMISARTLTNMPEFVFSQVGAKGLAKVYAATGLNEEVLGDQHHYILQSQLSGFIEASARQLGEQRLGLLLAPHLSIQDYGIFGAYVSSGTTLLDALRRTMEAIQYHGSHDRIMINIDRGQAIYRYHFASRRIAGHENIAYCAVGVMLSIMRDYLGPQWCPEFIQIDIRKPSFADTIEAVFGSKVVFGGRGVALYFDERHLSNTRFSGKPKRLISMQDLENGRNGGGPTSTIGIVRELVGAQILDANVSLEKTARIMGFSKRTLQRTLDGDGTNFRSIVNSITAERAVNLLKETDYTIMMISEALGYSDPAHFTRAFKNSVGIAPSEYKIANFKTT